MGNFFAGRIELGLFEGDSGQDEVLFFEPLLEEELVGRVRGDLVERVWIWIHFWICVLGFGVGEGEIRGIMKRVFFLI
ncbi:hypothetical protein CASFOL_018760 [Castilleja foliolosa]|uniref:Uncharacterized protein n=1 Tax=Castilleja foliolosa TaxID=1961234 RepID=A0ABD3DA06_9LAMI